MAITVENTLDGGVGAPVTDAALAASAVTGTVTIADPTTRAVYSDATTILGRTTALVTTGHHRAGATTGEGAATPRLVAALPSPPWAIRFYLYLPDLLAAGNGSTEARWIADLGSHGLVVFTGTAGNINLRLQPTGLAATWAVPSLSGTAKASQQLLRCELTCDGTTTRCAVYVGDSTTDARVHTWTGLVPTGGTAMLTGYRYRTGVLLQPGAQGPEVVARQEQLLVWNPNILPQFGADGDYGQETVNAVTAFQQAFGLSPVDGEIGPETGAALDLMVQLTQGTATPPPLHLGWPAIATGATEIGPAQEPPDGVTATARGGILLGGAASVSRRAIPSAAGGIGLGGSAAVSKRVTVSAAGGIVLGGAASVSKHAKVSASGGLVFGGSASTGQGTSLFIDYAAGHVSDPFEPTDDDQHIRNDVTVERRDGSSARAVQETGPLSVLPPPAGVGVYDESITLNLASDDQLDSQASWRLHVGTVDKPRYPQVRVDLSNKAFLVDDVTSRDSGDWLRIINPPHWLPPTPIDLLVQGYEERIGVYTWNVTFNASDASAYLVGEVWSPAEVGGPDRADTAGSELTTAVGATDTVLSIATTTGPPWVDSAGHPDEFPFEIVCGGEIMRVTAVTGTTSPQLMTVVRGVNGVTKSHGAGAPVALAEPAIVAL